MRDQMASMGDLERIGSRIAARRVLPREIVQLSNALTAITELQKQLVDSGNAQLGQLAEAIDPMAEVRERIATQVYPDPQNNNIMKGGVIADGVDMELDDLRRVALHGKDVLHRFNVARVRRRVSHRSKSAITTSLVTISRCATRIRTRCLRAGFASRR